MTSKRKVHLADSQQKSWTVDIPGSYSGVMSNPPNEEGMEQELVNEMKGMDKGGVGKG